MLPIVWSIKEICFIFIKALALQRLLIVIVSHGQQTTTACLISFCLVGFGPIMSYFFTMACHIACYLLGTDPMTGCLVVAAGPMISHCLVEVGPILALSYSHWSHDIVLFEDGSPMIP